MNLWWPQLISQFFKVLPSPCWEIYFSLPSRLLSSYSFSISRDYNILLTIVSLNHAPLYVLIIHHWINKSTYNVNEMLTKWNDCSVNHAPLYVLIMHYWINKSTLNVNEMKKCWIAEDIVIMHHWIMHHLTTVIIHTMIHATRWFLTDTRNIKLLDNAVGNNEAISF